MLPAVAVILALLALPAMADPLPDWLLDLRDGIVAYESDDYETALRFLPPVAERGEAFAQLYLGDMYRLGRGVPQDYVQAVSWYRKSAEQGNIDAQHTLAYMYVNGKGVPRDYVQAHLWINLAISREPRRHVHRDRVRQRDELAAVMTREQIARAQRLAREWKPKGR